MERLIAWLLDHSNLEVPDLESTAKETPPTPPTAAVATEPPSSRGEAVMVYESSSDSSGSSDVDVVDVEGELMCSTPFSITFALIALLYYGQILKELLSF